MTFFSLISNSIKFSFIDSSLIYEKFISLIFKSKDSVPLFNFVTFFPSINVLVQSIDFV